MAWQQEGCVSDHHSASVSSDVFIPPPLPRLCCWARRRKIDNTQSTVPFGWAFVGFRCTLAVGGRWDSKKSGLNSQRHIRWSCHLPSSLVCRGCEPFECALQALGLCCAHGWTGGEKTADWTRWWRYCTRGTLVGSFVLFCECDHWYCLHHACVRACGPVRPCIAPVLSSCVVLYEPGLP